jgi:DNA-binding HxlR family transcriptional regulator
MATRPPTGPRQGPAVEPAPARRPGRGAARAVAPGTYAPSCATRRALDILADKWASLVLASLADGAKRFQQLRRDVGGVTQKMLTQTLRALERDGLVSRHVHPGVPAPVEYRLTALGCALKRALAELRAWAEAHMGDVEAARAAADAARRPE